MAKLLRVTASAKVLGIHPITLRRWIAEGKMTPSYSAAGQMVFEENYLKQLIADKTPNRPEVMVFYTRVSGRNDSSLASQSAHLESIYGPATKVYSDTASGLKSDRKGLAQLLDDARAGKFTKVVVTHQDRLARFGVEFIERLLSDYRVELVIDSTVTDEPHEVLLQDFMSLLASFSGRFYAMRGIEQKKKLLRKAEEELNDQGDNQ